MNEKAATKNGSSLAGNWHVQELTAILKDNGKDAAWLAELTCHFSDMEGLLRNAEKRISQMETQLGEMREIQKHPIKTGLQNTTKELDGIATRIIARTAKAKSGIIDGCKTAVTAFKEKGASALNQAASFFHIKNILQTLKDDNMKGVNTCDKAIARINAFSNEYHSAGRAIKNLGRMLTGREPIAAPKEPGNLAKALISPYKAWKANLLEGARNLDKMLSALDKLEQGVEARHEARGEEQKQPARDTRGQEPVGYLDAGGRQTAFYSEAQLTSAYIDALNSYGPNWVSLSDVKNKALLAQMQDIPEVPSPSAGKPARAADAGRDGRDGSPERKPVAERQNTLAGKLAANMEKARQAALAAPKPEHAPRRRVIAV